MKAKRAKTRMRMDEHGQPINIGFEPNMRGIQPVDRVLTQQRVTGVKRPFPWQPDDVLIIKPKNGR